MKPAKIGSQIRIKCTLARIFAFGAFTILLATTIFWAVLASRLQAANADQLIDGYLFESSRTFHAATFPGAHTFLLKWPLFALSGLLGNTTSATAILTVLCALAPVLLLAVVIYKVERRPAVFGLWCLALASCLLLVPAQPSPGALLPVNFGMLATRNLEYVLFIAVLWLLVRSRRLVDRNLLFAVVVAAILVASDKLFVPLLLGAVVFVGIIRVIWPNITIRPSVFSRYARWFGAVVVGIIGAYGILQIIQSLHVTGITNQSSPYKLVTQPQAILEAIAYGVSNIATLFGANPIYYHVSLSGVPTELRHSATHLSILSYALNGLVLLVIVLGALVCIVKSRRATNKNRRYILLAGLLLGASFAASLVYVITDHYYPVDSRYLTIWFFTLPIMAAIGFASLEFSRVAKVLIAVLLLGLLPFATKVSYDQYQLSRDAQSQRVDFNNSVGQALERHKVKTVIGNYWDVVPIRSTLTYRPNIIPLVQCTESSVALTSSIWRQFTAGDSAAVVINESPPPTGFQNCLPDEVVAVFGAPSQVLPVMGHAQSFVYIYNATQLKSLAIKVKAAPKTESLIGYKSCKSDRLLTVVPHEDDDLLFMNPAMQQAISAGNCLTTVYMTAGDAGSGREYWQGRRAGAEAAYALMYKRPNIWHHAHVKVAGHMVTVGTLQNVPHVRLIFMNLPDGNIDGSGFASQGYQSLHKLRRGVITRLTSVDGSQSYTSSEIDDFLVRIMQIAKPNNVYTLNYTNDIHDGDHSDHHAAGQYTAEALTSYAHPAELHNYMGYPVSGLPTNISEAQISNKEATFFAYAAHDGATCNSIQSCSKPAVYLSFLLREYSHSDASPHSANKSAPTTHTHKLPPRSGCVIGGKKRLIYCVPRQ